MDKNETKVAAEMKTKQVRVAAAWTLAKTLLPSAPHAEQVKFARNLMANSTPALKVALRQTAINAHWTRVAEQFAKVHKVDMNDLLEDPSVLSKEKSAVTSELKGDAKNAAAKVADDRKDAGPLPTEYPEPKRTEPTELDGSNADKGRPESWTEGPGSKEAAKKASCGEDCKGCENCDATKKEAAKKETEVEKLRRELKEEKEKNKGKKDASAKKAEEEAPKPKEEAPKDEEGEEKHEGEEAADKAATEGAEEAVEGAEDVADEEKREEAAAEGDTKPEETFDPAKVNLEEAAADLSKDVDKIQEAIAELGDEPSDITFGDEEAGGADDFFGDINGEEGLPPVEGEEGLPGAPDAEGQELNLGDIFSGENMADKVSALNDEGALEIELGEEDFFKPSNPGELEAFLEEEEKVDSPASMFSAGEEENDPLARILGSLHTAGEEGIVAPGDLVSEFESNAGNGQDGRDSESDHEESIFEEVFRSLKQPERSDSRDTHSNLKSPKEAGKKTATIRQIKPVAKEAKDLGANLASLLMGSDDDFMN